jgi:hypothetical protein
MLKIVFFGNFTETRHKNTKDIKTLKICFFVALQKHEKQQNVENCFFATSKKHVKNLI